MRVSVISGNSSAEKEISIAGGQHIVDTLKLLGHEAFMFEADENLPLRLIDCSSDVAFPVLHGRGGEDGTVQGLLEVLRIPYVGSDILGSALCNNKVWAKQICRSHSIPTPNFVYYHCPNSSYTRKFWKQFSDQLVFPVIIKPARGGSGFGVSIANNIEEVIPAINNALQLDSEVIIERYINGREITVLITAVPKPKIVSVLEINRVDKCLEFRSRYRLDNDVYLLPANLIPLELTSVVKLSIQAYEALRCRDLAKVDIIITPDSQPYLLEVDTMPGMTPFSLLCKVMAKEKKGFAKLIDRLIRQARHRNYLDLRKPSNAPL